MSNVLTVSCDVCSDIISIGKMTPMSSFQMPDGCFVVQSAIGSVHICEKCISTEIQEALIRVREKETEELRKQNEAEVRRIMDMQGKEIKKRTGMNPFEGGE